MNAAPTVLTTPNGDVIACHKDAWGDVYRIYGVVPTRWVFERDGKPLRRRGGVAASVTASSCEPGSRAPRSLGRAARRAGVPNGSAGA